MTVNFKFFLNESINLFSHVLSHLNYGNLSSIYNPKYIENIKDLRSKENNIDLISLKIKSINNGNININWDKYYQALTFFSYHNNKPTLELIKLIQNNEFLKEYLHNWSINIEERELVLLSKTFSFILKLDYEQFYKDYWKNNLIFFTLKVKEFQKYFNRFQQIILQYLNKINSDIEINNYQVFCVDSYDNRGKSIKGIGAGIGIAKNKTEQLYMLPILLHELIHHYTDPLLEKNGYTIKTDPKSDNLNHLRMEATVNYALTLLFEDIIGLQLPKDKFIYNKDIIPVKLKNTITNASKEIQVMRENAVYSIKTFSINNNKKHELLPSSDCNEYEIIPELYRIGESNKNSILYSALMCQAFELEPLLLNFLQVGNFSTKELDVLKRAKILIPKNCNTNKLYPHTHITNKSNYLRIHVTEDCSLRCVYCYLEGGKKIGKTSIEKISTLIDQFIDIKSPLVTVNLHGGGEPLMDIALVKEIVKTVNSKIKNIQWTIQTNGIISERTIDFLNEHNFQIGISIDGPPDIQNQQRPGINGKKFSEFTEKAIAYVLKTKPENLLTISVITNYSVHLQKDILKYLYNLGVQRAVFDPLTELGRVFTSQVSKNINNDMVKSPNLLVFCKNFLDALNWASDNSMVLTTDFIRTAFMSANLLDRNCNACSSALNLTTDGYLTACTRGFSLDESKNNLFVFGEYENESKSFQIFKDKQKLLQDRSVYNIEKCKKCYLKFSCAGDCMLELYKNNGEISKIIEGRCLAKKFFSLEYIKRIFNRSYSSDKEFSSLE
jgi:uncharacterized protein